MVMNGLMSILESIMNRNDALKVIILSMIEEFKFPPVMRDILNRFAQTTIEMYSYELSRLLWKMQDDGLIYIPSRFE
jgi:hypothetical protein